MTAATLSAPAPISVGILGTGAMAATMGAALGLSPAFAISAVGSASSPERAQALAARLPGAPRALTREALLADERIRLVYVVSATADHEADALAALAAGKDVLVEKPLALSAEGAARVAEAARAAGRFCMEAMWTPFLPAWQALEASAVSGELGRPRHLAFSFGYPVDPAQAPRLFAPGPGQGVLLDRAVYGVACALRLLGPAEGVHADLRRDPATGLDVEAFLQIRHAGGATSQVAASMTALLSNAATLGCERGSLTLDPPTLGGESVSRIAMAPGGIGGGGGLKARLRRSPLLRRLQSMRGGPERSRHPWGADQYLPMLTHVAERLAAGATESDRQPLSATQAVLALLDEAARG
ncbi:Gfo/Idh/MocA family oxidoreductase [Albimonas sp. CAU 1670]|uniref:Gfo/Idh/MocA family protein n=1 Tax=Albimonas sp. CAU 1670 TaxID=3032599 RepID=UPI0023DB84BE|nr:Gfo/Idh/MocA family oxidoreductase [Albimonas sp. CAU 1670]MDF2231622.1 Gfo/Idh/MocA family oxidoreductase [Albimonas sp. CAU 1670]